jgi:hypothetical protein
MNLFRLFVFPLVAMIVFSLPASLNFSPLQMQYSSAQMPNNDMAPTTSPQVSTIGQSLSPAGNTITKSFSYPLIRFYGTDSDYLTQTISWYQNGTVALSDSQGNNLSFDLPVSKGTFTLLQNDTTIDQKFVGTGLHYDVYWKAVKDKDGFTTKYKFSIAGGSSNGYQMQLPLRSTETIVPQANMFLAVSAHNLLNNATSQLQGIGLDWSDAASLGYKASFDKSHNYITMNLGTSYFIDPSTVDTVSVAISPSSGDYYEGERRVVSFGANIWTFYFDGSNIAYKYSSDGGKTWSTKSNVSTGAIASDSSRWTITGTTISGTNYVTLLYYTVSGSNTNFYGQRGTVGSTSISWASPTLLFTVSGTSLAAAAAATTDTNGYVYAGFRYISSDYHYRIMESTDGGSTWSTSLGDTDSGDFYRIEMSLSRLSSGNMLFAYAKYDTAELTYRVFSGGSWGTEQTTSGSGMSASTVKQISSDSDSTQSTYVAYLTGGNSGTLKVARWTNTGSFNTFETVNSGASFALPSITITTKDSMVHVYAINKNNNNVWETDKVSTSWVHPSRNQFSTGTFTADQLTSGFSYAVTLWVENTTPNNLVYGQACNPNSGAVNCYAQYSNGVTSSPYGNRFTTTITSLQVSNTNPSSLDFINVEQWLILQGPVSAPTEWLENGFTVGELNNVEYSPTSYHAYKYPSSTYAETADTSVNSGTHTYTIYGDQLGNWYWQIDSGTPIGPLSTTIDYGTGEQVGTESSDQTPVIPTSSLSTVQVEAGGSWQNWPSGISQNMQDYPPVWIYNCGGSNNNFHVGYGVQGTC